MQVEEHYISIDSRIIYARLINWKSSYTKSPIVLLHDALGSVAQWKNYPQRLAELTGLPVLIYDRFGHGLSDPEPKAPDSTFLDKEALVILPEILHHFTVQKPILYGHSDGGTIALIYASKIKAEALVLEAAHVMVETVTKAGVLKTEENGEAIIHKLTPYHGDKAKDLFNYWSKLWGGELMKDWNIEYLLGRIDIPTMILQGKNDNYGTEIQVDRIAKGIKGESDILLIDDCGHAPYKEQPAIVLEKLKDFLIKNQLINNSL